MLAIKTMNFVKIKIYKNMSIWFQKTNVGENDISGARSILI